jgi:hypothetical protein
MMRHPYLRGPLSGRASVVLALSRAYREFDRSARLYPKVDAGATSANATRQLLERKTEHARVPRSVFAR